MKLIHKILISAAVGFFAMLLYSTPMWWGVLFSPMTQSLTTAELTEDVDGGFRWEVGDTVLRFKSIDLLLSFLHLS